MGDESIAIGSNAGAENVQSIAIGKSSVTGESAVGILGTADGNNSISIGSSAHSYSFGEVSLGLESSSYSGSINSFVPTDRLFIIGNGNGSGSDAFSILKNGKTGIGYDNFETTTLDSLLQVNGSILSADLSGACSSLASDADGKIICGGGGGNSDWSLNGNTLGISPAYLGTTDDSALKMITNNNVVGVFTSDNGGFDSDKNSVALAAGDVTMGYNMFIFGNGAGRDGSSTPYESIFMGENSGRGTTSSTASYSIFMGSESAHNANDIYNSIVLGYSAASNATGQNYHSVIIGSEAASSANSTIESVILGDNAAKSASSFSRSVALGAYAGAGANMSYGVMIGHFAGRSGTSVDSSGSVFIGPNAGDFATGAPINSIFIGDNAGAGDTVDNSVGGGYSIAIGQQAKTGGFSNSI